ncbi:MAG: hypothetical protein JWM71_2527 [Solirubrobacteraceae bacterium]|nr:hypothetical protein [Solirubrobacteraceae bacterium]
MQEPMEHDPAYDRIRAAIASVEAPHALREHIAAERDRTLTRRLVVKRMKLTGLLAGAAAVAGVVLALVAPSGNGGPPSADQVAALATRPVAAGAPAVDRANTHLLRISEDGVPFPKWSERFPWKAAGRRNDTVGGRATQTVFYDNPAGVRLAYTIVGGSALAWPHGARTVTSNGVEVHLLHQGHRVIAVWRELGHTCVISAPDSVSDQHMIGLASARTYIA